MTWFCFILVFTIWSSTLLAAGEEVWQFINLKQIFSTYFLKYFQFSRDIHAWGLTFHQFKKIFPTYFLKHFQFSRDIHAWHGRPLIMIQMPRLSICTIPRFWCTSLTSGLGEGNVAKLLRLLWSWHQNEVFKVPLMLLIVLVILWSSNWRSSYI